MNLIQTDMTTPEVVELHKTIREQIAASEKQTKTMICLTWATIFLAFVQAAASVIQIFS